jgi:hypothetical protein
MFRSEPGNIILSKKGFIFLQRNLYFHIDIAVLNCSSLNDPHEKIIDLNIFRFLVALLFMQKDATES